MEILIITGLSGGGKSRAASYLEDIGYYTVDNLPAEMMVKFADFCAGSSGRYDRVALVYDVRSGEPTDILIETLERLMARRERIFDRMSELFGDGGRARR